MEVDLPDEVLAVVAETCPLYRGPGQPWDDVVPQLAGLVVYDEGTVISAAVDLAGFGGARSSPRSAWRLALDPDELERLRATLTALPAARVPHWLQPTGDIAVGDAPETVVQVQVDAGAYELRGYAAEFVSEPAEAAAVFSSVGDLRRRVLEDGAPLGPADLAALALPLIEGGKVCGG
jgi:hypothetical protein